MKVEETFAYVKAELLLMEREILGNILKLSKRKNVLQRLGEVSRRRQDGQFGRE